MKNVLVASTYYENDKPVNDQQPSLQRQIPNKVWLKLQMDFLHRHTINYDFAVYLNTVKNKGLFNNCIVIGKDDSKAKDARYSHRRALRETIKYFRAHKDEYKAFCILDSDCFPIKKGWAGKLLAFLAENNLKFASVVRYENGESFPHPSALFIPSEHIEEDLFRFPDEFVVNVPNIINGVDTQDTGTEMSFWQNGIMVGFPLMRSNVVNLHPIYAGIYGDLFYHHGLGSRIRKIKDEAKAIEPKTTWKAKSYWNDYGNYRKAFWMFFDLIIKNPVKFINVLRGEPLKTLKAENFLGYFSKDGILTDPFWK